jgi:hypothetical protein
MYGLLYPAVLGTVFVLFISDDLIPWQLSPRSTFGIVFLIHWCLEFVLANQEETISGYSLVEFAGDFVLIVIIYNAFVAFPRTSEGGNYTALYIWVTLIPVVFLVVDLIRWASGDARMARPIVFVDVAVLIMTSIWGFAAAEYPNFASSTNAASWFVLGVFLASLLSFIVRKNRFVKIGRC